jgi:hypothetical protein
MKKETVRYFILFGLVLFLCNVQVLIAAPAEQYELVPDEVKIGDILFMDIDGWPMKSRYIYHTALYIGNNQLIHIASNDEGFDDIITSDWNDFLNAGWIKPGSLKFYRVTTASEAQIEDAIDWIYERRDNNAEFQDWWFGMRKISDPNFRHVTANKFYCSELPWAAYYNQGIDIDSNGWFPLFFENCPFAHVWKCDIILDSDTSKVWP